jgi:hypothetical protein
MLQLTRPQRIVGALLGAVLSAGAVVAAASGAAARAASGVSTTVSAIGISPSACVVGRTDSTQLAAEATLRDGSREDITSNPRTRWLTANASIATADRTGTVVGVNVGVTTVTVAFDGATRSVSCAVGP